MAHFFVRVHDDPRLYWCMADLSLLRVLELTRMNTQSIIAIFGGHRVRIGGAAILAFLLDRIGFGNQTPIAPLHRAAAVAPTVVNALATALSWLN